MDGLTGSKGGVFYLNAGYRISAAIPQKRDERRQYEAREASGRSVLFTYVRTASRTATK
jgi:hypothetical protein